MTTTKYSDKIDGDKWNYNWSATFDVTSDGYLGISQAQVCGVDRVLLTPHQVNELVAFLKKNKRRRKTETKR